MGEISRTDYMTHDAMGLAALVEAGEVAPSELLEAAIRRAEEVNPRINAIVVKHYGEARKRAGGKIAPAPFRGVPFLLKDLGVGLAGTATTGGSRFLQDAIAERNTELVDRYLAAGLVTLMTLYAGIAPDRFDRASDRASRATMSQNAKVELYDVLEARASEPSAPKDNRTAEAD